MINDFAMTSNTAQAAYRQSTYLHHAIFKCRHESGREQQIPVHLRFRTDKTYKDNASALHVDLHDAYKAGFISTDVFLLRIGTDLNRLANDGRLANNARYM